MEQPVPLLVEPEWLAARLDDAEIRIIDARWRGEFDAGALYHRAHIPGATHIDWARELRTHGAAPRGVPDPETFAALMSRHGIDEHIHVIAYADDDYSGATRLWWALRYYGHTRVSVLNGGLNAWLAAGFSVTDEPTTPRPGRFNPQLTPALRATRADVLSAIGRAGNAIVDTRTYEQFEARAVWSPLGNIFATEQERVTVDGVAIRPGRIPGAIHLNSSENLDPARSWRFRPAAALADRAQRAGLRPDQRVITYCGVGISASLGLFSLALAGYSNVALYDASWEEWGSDPSLPVETD